MLKQLPWYWCYTQLNVCNIVFAGEGLASPASPALPVLQKLSPRLPGSRPDTPLSSKSSVSPALSRPGTPLSSLTSRTAHLFPPAKPASPGVVMKNAFIKRSATSPSLLGNGSSSIRKRGLNSEDCDAPVKKQTKYDSRTDGVQLKDLPGTHINGLLCSSKSFTSDGIRSADSQLTPVDTSTPRSDSFALRRNANLTVKTEFGLTDPGTPSPLTPSTPSSHTPRSSKVKTTAQLLAELRAKNLTSASKEIVSKITHNQIRKEVDPISEPVVPASAKPRPRRKPGTIPAPPGTDILSQTKTEMVEKFLRTSVAATEDNLYKPDSLEHPESLSFSTDIDNSQSYVSNDSHQSVKTESPSGSPAPEPGPSEVKVESEVDPYTLLPPLNPDVIDWESDTYEPFEEYEVTQSHVDKLLNENWCGVNGLPDHQGEWRDWTSTYAMPSYNGDLIYILPYVSVDD